MRQGIQTSLTFRESSQNLLARFAPLSGWLNDVLIGRRTESARHVKHLAGFFLDYCQ